MFAGGGTGGHLFPALAVAGELRARHPSAEIGFIGSRRGLERKLVPDAGYPLWTLSVGGLKGRGLTGWLTSVPAAGWAVARCLFRMIRRRPDLVIGIGGYASGPAALAALQLRIPTMVLEQNHFPGATNRWLAPRVDAVCAPSPEAAARMRGRRIVTGNPVRPEFTRIGPPPLAETLSLLVFGGSRGARSLNRAMVAALGALGRLRPVPRIVHQTGPDDEREVSAAYAASYPRERYEVRAFIDDMPQRFEAADLVVSRAGATTIAELAAAGRGSLLVPYPFAADDHQTHNARVLETAGAAVLLSDRELGETGRLAGEIAALAADRAALGRMGRAAAKLARPDAAERIADVAERLLAGEDPEGTQRGDRGETGVS